MTSTHHHKHHHHEKRKDSIDPDSLSSNEIGEYKDAFKLFDKNNDGSISAKELGDVMRALGAHPGDEFVENLIKENDFDGSGEIEFKEFITMMGKANKEQDLRESFHFFDKDGSGKISKSELRTVLEKLGQRLSDRELDDMMKEVDLNGDGEVDYEEFKKMMES